MSLTLNCSVRLAPLVGWKKLCATACCLPCWGPEHLDSEQKTSFLLTAGS